MSQLLIPQDLLAEQQTAPDSGFQDTPQNEAATSELVIPQDLQAATPAPAAVKDYILPASKVAGIDVERIRADFEEAKRSNVMLPVAQEHGYALKEGRLINERIPFAQRTAANIDQWLPRTKEEYLRSGAGMVAASFDDMDNMGMFERVIAETRMAYNMGNTDLAAQKILYRQFLGQGTEQDKKELSWLQAQSQAYAHARQDEGFLTGSYRSLFQTILPQVMGATQNAVKRGLESTTALWLASAATGAAAPVSAGGAFVAGLGAGAVEYAFEQAVSEAYGSISQLKDVDGKPVVSDDAARLIAGVAALPSTALELTGLGVALKNMPGFDRLLSSGAAKAAVAAVEKGPALMQVLREGGRRVLTTLAAETATEVGQEAVLMGAEKLAESMTSRAVPRGQLPGERLRETAYEAAKAFFIPAAFGGIGGGVGTWRAVRRKAAQAQGERDALTTLATAAQNSKMLAGAPTATEAALSNIMAGQDIYMDAAAAAALFQTDEGVDVARRMGLTEASVAEAIDLGHDVAIPAAKAAAHLMRSPLWQEMEPHTRLTATAATAEEAQRYADGDRTSAALAAEDFLSFLADVDNDIARKSSWKEWTAEYRSSLEQAGYTPLQAESFGDVLGAHAEVMAPLFGQTPDAYLSQRLNRIISTTPGRFAEEKTRFDANSPALTGEELAYRDFMKQPIAERDPLIGELWGQISPQSMDRLFSKDQIAALRKKYGRGFFAKKGQGVPVDVMAQQAVNRGFLPEGSTEDDLVTYLTEGSRGLNGARFQTEALQLDGGKLGVADDADIKDFIGAAREIYRQYQQQPAHRDDLGDIHFTRAGWGEMKNSGADRRKWKLIPYLPQIIEQAENKGERPLTKERKDGIAKFYWLEADVMLDGEPLRVGINIAEDDRGNRFYNLNQDLDDFKFRRQQKAANEVTRENKHGAHWQLEGETSPDGQNISPVDDGVNLQILAQGKESAKKAPLDKARGLITSRQLDGARMIALFKGKADISTIIHEGAGHFFLENLREAAALPNAPDWVKQDWQTVADYIGAGKADAKIPVDAHEKFARAAVEFFRTGKAPSGLLHSAFRMFSRWLSSIFKVARRYLVDREDITPEVADVFQRLMATEEDIAQAKAGLGLPQEKPAKVDPVKWDTYQKLAAKAEDEADKSIFLRRMDEEKRVEREARLEAQVLAAADPEQNAVRAYIEMGGVDYASLVEQFGEAAAMDLRDKWRGGAGKKLIKTGGDMTVEDLCTERGWSDIGQALAWLTETPTPREFADAVVEQRRAEWEAQYNPKAEAVASAAADAALRAYDEAVSGTAQPDTESMLRAMRKRIADKSMEAVDGEYEAMMAAWGRRTSARKLAEKLAAQEGKTLKDFEQTLARKAELAGAAVAEAEARADKAVLQEKWRAAKDMNALRRRSQETILQERQRRAALGEAYRARMERDRLITQVRRTARSKSMAPAYKEQVLALVSRFTGLGTQSMRPNRSDVPGLTAFLTEHAASSGLEVAEGMPMLPPVAPWLLETMEYGEPRRFNELTLDQQRDVYRAVKILQHMAGSEKKLLGEMRQREIDATVAELTESIDRLPERHHLTERERATTWGRIRAFLRDAQANRTMLRYLFKAADNFVSKGKSQRIGANEKLLMRPLVEAGNEELRLKSRYEQLLTEAMRPLVEQADLYKPLRIPEVALPKDVAREWGGVWDMEKVFCVALNMGNEGNLNALRKGYGWTDADLAAITGRLTAEQWQAVQAVWDTIDKLYPRLNDVYETLNGVPLPKVERAPLAVTAADGSTVRLGGGYYPLVFDRRFSDKAGRMEDVDDALNFTEAMLRTPNPKSGMTKTRTGGTLPPKLSADVVTRHITDTIHYVTHELPLRNVYQLTQDPRYAESFSRAFGVENYKLLLPWLRAIARPESINTSPGNKLVNWMAKRGTLAVLGFSFRTALMGITSLPNSISRVGMTPFLRGAAAMARHPVQQWKLITSLSPYMANRASMMDRDVGKALKQWRGTDNVVALGPLKLSRQRFESAAFSMITAVDALVALPTWQAAYDMALEHGKEMKDAIAEGDAAVLEAQAGGGTADMSALMRDPGMMRVFTVFMTFSANMYNRQLYMARGVAARLRGGADASAVTAKDAALFTALEMVAPPLLTAVMFGLLQEGEAPEAEDIGWELFGNVIQGFPLLRMLMGMIRFGSKPGESSAFRGVQAVGDVLRLGKDLTQGKLTTKKKQEKMLRQVINAAGFAWGVPTVQLWRTVDGIEAFTKGKGGPLTPLLGKPTEKKK